MLSILIVDDEPLVIKGIRIMLERTQLPIHSIREAENGEEALSQITEMIPDILITDIRMPKMGGLELCRKISKKCPQIAIIIVSGYEDFTFAQQAIKYGVRDYLLKPVNGIELIKVISDIIDKNEKSNKFLYIAPQELNNVISLLENGLWNATNTDVQEGLKRLSAFLKEAPLEYCVKLSNDINQILLSRLSLKIGYTLMMQTPQYAGKDKSSFSSWLNEVFKSMQSELADRRKNADYNLFVMAKEFIREHYKSEITLEELARKTGFSPNYFSQLFKIKTGKTFVQFKKEVRIERAMELLNQPDKSITEIAMDVGFNDSTYFIRAFKDYTGYTPSEYKRKRGI